MRQQRRDLKTFEAHPSSPCFSPLRRPNLAITMSLAERMYRHAAKEKMTIPAICAVLALAAVLCFLAPMTIPVINLALPRPSLGVALLVFAALLLSVHFWLRRRATRQTKDDSREQGLSTVAETGFHGMLSVSLPAKPKIRICISGDRESLTVWKLGEAGELRVWLDVVNLTDAPIKLDRILGELCLANATIASFTHHRKATIGANEYDAHFISAKLSPEEIRAVEAVLRQNKQPDAGLNLTVYVQTKGDEIELFPRLALPTRHFVNFAALS